MTLLARGLDLLVRTLEGAAAVDGGVVYSRGAEAIELTAWVGRLEFRRTPQEQTAVLAGQRDYLFAAADLRLGGGVATPKKGDRITERVDGQDLVYEISAPADEPVWRYSDQSRRIIRVHTKRVTPT